MEFQVLENCLPKHPARMLICGLTMCGKTTFIRDLLLHKHSPYEALYICAHRLNQPAYRNIIDTLSDQGIPVTTFTTIPEEAIEFDPSKKNCLIVDDLIEEAEKSRYMGHLLRDGSHHDNTTLVLVSHWVCGGGDARRQRLQMDYMIFFRFPADKEAGHGIGCQIAPGKVDRFMEIYEDATSEQYRPLIVDLSNAYYVDPRLRFRCSWDEVYPDAENL
jgi:hypothetical protein